MTCRNTTNRRNAELAKIHMAKKQLGMDDDVYRDMLWTIGRVRSSADLDAAGREAVLEHLKGIGFKGGRKKGQGYPGKPKNSSKPDRHAIMRKIEALLAEAKRPWSYADGMAKRMFHVDRLTFCRPDQLEKIMIALQKDARRHDRVDAGE